MTDTERIKMALPLLQALADGKQLQFRMPNDEWRAMELDCDAVLEQPTSYRIAPDLPPKPSQKWLDTYGMELTGECREPIQDGTTLHFWHEDAAPQTYSSGLVKENAWILRKREPRYAPWTLETVPMPFPQIEIRGHITEVEWADDVGVKLRDGWQHTYASLFREGKTRDGLPCGRRVEA